ncbi:pentapeptide repeat-containing protein [Modestobacter sp. I12A-02628]|uniref:Pentapeptide repeat-containing protein n=1 Tax=Goekera deserti TaxID=2497753 RepID=A0A7K3WI60_9ACTN|nr:pentapeptide repeat-containing protein [Goekera deserti]MPQ97786.1 pentapeptide repeat-containing protein [Goekera deserti]NDI48431.1 pentapeptide repeat-containing protein [Goekera deserti]NEL56032.1 pentapeptide repeat-containing protein [Goekera deserti]
MPMDAAQLLALVPEPDPAPGPELHGGGSADGLRFAGLTLTGDATGAHLLECVVQDCDLGEVRFDRARLSSTLLADVRAATLSLGEADLLDVVLERGRFGALVLQGAELTRVLLQDVKVDFVDVRGARLTDVTLRGCDIGALDAGSADLRRVQLVDCRVGSLELSGSRSRSVDLSGAEIGRLDGVDQLRGCTISSEQLQGWAPAIAAQLGITVA